MYVMAREQKRLLREFAADTLKVVEADGIAGLERLLGDEREDPGVRKTAVLALGRLSPDMIWQRLLGHNDSILDLLLLDATQAAKYRELGTIHRISPPTSRSLTTLAETLTDGSSRARYVAAVALGSMGEEAEWAMSALVQAALYKGASDHDRIDASHASDIDPAAARSAAVHALGSIGPAAVSALSGLMEDEREELRLREDCARALGRIGIDAVPALEEAVRQEGSGVRKAASEALGVIGPEASSAMPTLVKVVDDKSADEQLRVVCIQALGSIGI